MLPLLVGFLLATAPAMQPSCNAVPKVDDLLDKPGVRWIVAGEVHGTNEMPAAFADLVCAASRGTRKVVVALEHPVSEQGAIDEYLSSNGDENAKARLLSSPNWHRALQDGRTSSAYLALLDRLRAMKQAGLIGGVVAFQPGGKPLSAADYEAEMASTVRAAGTPPDVLVVGLVGNTHARIREFTTPKGESYMPMAGLLPPDRTVTLSMSGNGGTAWFCMMAENAGTDTSAGMRCSSHAVKAPNATYPRGIDLTGDADAPYSGYFNLGTSLTASPPAAKPETLTAF